MAATSHKIGTFFLLGAVALLAVTNITAPVVKSISLLKININHTTASPDQHPVLVLGTYGYCITNSTSSHSSNNANTTVSENNNGTMKSSTDGNHCSPVQFGYNTVSVVGEAAGLQFTPSALDTGAATSKLTVLHPIAAGTSALAALLSLGAGSSGSCTAFFMTLLALCSTITALVVDYVVLNMIRAGLTETPAAGASAEFGAGMWTLLGAAGLLGLGTVMSLFACCGGSRRSRRDDRYSKEIDH
ncbi:hypothetical protein MCOR07_009136 [Pyricularia oryzae]|uniref:Pali-domain-containing protein n=1 Tax=Pyricularia grisea TaxID=148305 RepID=A0ABQ8NWD1_PYRGI|nr:hypothetical protein MCOR01_008791 [Pyricularia oryzae]KAI6301775.1 hypothetical protein MCOR33_002759 [Pyricularia grisea]KAI6254741.1 hypothetical protein MCOR19_008743 [Pyricularia oryzae]KAI6273772.1 hypothetical protein MCOR26_006778 [Pyricularia oryzae]KAI6328589.1 hypothetical protein MCOR29_002595 [Pyricularia oryzae]